MAKAKKEKENKYIGSCSIEVKVNFFEEGWKLQKTLKADKFTNVPEEGQKIGDHILSFIEEEYDRIDKALKGEGEDES